MGACCVSEDRKDAKLAGEQKAALTGDKPKVFFVLGRPGVGKGTQC